MRLFISINLPEEFNRYFRELQRRLDECANLNLSHAGRKSGFHLTLVFLGDVDFESAKKIQDMLKTVDFESFTLRLGKKLNVFKGFDGGVKTVFVDIDPLSSGFAALLNLQKRVADVVEKWRIGKFDSGEKSEIENFDGTKEERVENLGTEFDVGGRSVNYAEKFVPHLTLTRVKFCPKNISEKFVSEISRVEIEQKEFKVDSFYLMESRLGPGGSVYSEILRRSAGG
jgi:2'-5' RNA ligase